MGARAAGLGVLASGCLWIGPGAHEARQDAFAIGAVDVRLAPDAWSACIDSPPQFVLMAEVNATHAGQSFTGKLGRDGAFVTLGPTAANADATGAVALALAVVPSAEVWAAWSAACATAGATAGGGCTVTLDATIERLGASETHPVPLSILPAATPTMGAVEVEDFTGAASPIGDVAAAATPVDALAAVTWPTLAFTVTDPHLPHGLGGTASVWMCPGDAPDPLTCAVVAAAPDTDHLLPDGMRFRAPTALLGARSCPNWAGTAGYRTFVTIDDGVCAPQVVLPFPPDAAGVRFYADDCDADGASSDEDCNDVDPTIFPGAPEIWYDGVDEACDGGDDNDQDGDGHASDAAGGDDCDDTDATSFPGGYEVCDGRDNDCNPGVVESGVTWISGTSVQRLTSLAEALEVAVDGDEIALCAGTYAPFHVDADLIVRGTLDPGAVIVDGNYVDKVLTIGNPANPTAVVTLQGLTLKNGRANDGGAGIDARGALSLTVVDCVVTQNDARPGDGGGIWAGGTLSLVGTTVSSNDAGRGGGIATVRGAVVDLSGSSVTANDAEALGGGFYGDDLTLTLDPTSEVSFNTVAAGHGGGIAAVGDLDVEGGSFSSNHAPFGKGGGFWVDGSNGAPTVTIDHASIVDNDAQDGAGVALSLGTDVTLDDSTVSGNDASVAGGGVWASSSGGVLDVTLRDTTFSDNIADDGGAVWVDGVELSVRGGAMSTNAALRWGGGLYASDSDVELGTPLSPIDLTENDAEEGGAAYLTASTLDRDGGAISGNTARVGAGLRIVGGGLHTVDDGTIEGNLAEAEGGGFSLEGAQLEAGGVLAISGNVPDGGVVRAAGTFTACSYVVIDDEVVNEVGGSETGACFEVQSDTTSDTCGC